MIAVGLVGTLLAARLSDATGAAFALGNQIAQMLFVLFRVVGAGVSVVVTQCLGGNRRDMADRVARASLGAASWIGLGCAAIAALGGGALMRLLNAPPEVLPLAVPYLMAAAPALLLDAWIATLASVLRAHLYARFTLSVVVVMQLTQLVLAWPLMQRFGLPGFALGMVLHRLLGGALLLWLWRLKLQLEPLTSDWWRLPREELAQVLHIGVPGAAENIAWRVCFVVSLAAIGAMGAQALATHAYAYQLMMCILPFSLAVGLSGEILVGHLVGAGELHQASRLVRRALGRGMAVSTGLALAFGLFGEWLLRLFTDDAHIIATGRVLLWCSVAVESGRAFNLVLVNALRAAGDA
ncbi:MAG: MATE family efflux transporter, partial [Burkholderiales bacterium]|nr:MATE family efflux transporter [Burkholderiales bacterium]